LSSRLRRTKGASARFFAQNHRATGSPAHGRFSFSGALADWLRDIADIMTQFHLTSAADG
jgi:hypothetical protein